MISLLLAIICSTAIALVLKYGEERNCNRFVILSLNYAMATSISLWLVVKKDLFNYLGSLSLNSLSNQLTGNSSGTEGFLTSENSALWALVIGIPTGVLYFLGFFYYQKSVKESGVGMAGSYAKLGILIPMIFSLVFWREFPSGLQWVGMFLALGAILMVNLDFKSKNIFSSLKPALLLLFLSSGISEFTNKLYQRYGMLEVKDFFLFFLFGTALLISLSKIRKKPDAREIITGLAVGVPNFFASFFLINALSKMPASVVFPTYSAGSIALICVGGMVFYKEKLSRKEFVAIVLTMVALLLLNI